MAEQKAEKLNLRNVAGKDLNKAKVREVVMNDYNSRGRGRSNAEKKTSREKYLARKRIVLDLEKRNKQYLVLYPASDADTNEKKFYNMGGVSAVIYVHEIAPKLKRKAKLRRDMDSCKDSEKFHSGICSVQNLETLEELLKKYDIVREDIKNDLVLFKLPHEYSRAEIKRLFELEQERIDQLNQILYPTIINPQIHQKILELKRAIPRKVKNMEKTYRDVVGREAMDSLMVLIRSYSEMAHGNETPEIAGRRIIQECDMLLSIISLMNELRLWDIESSIAIASDVAKLKQLTVGYLTKKEEHVTKGDRKLRLA